VKRVTLFMQVDLALFTCSPLFFLWRPPRANTFLLLPLTGTVQAALLLLMPVLFPKPRAILTGQFGTCPKFFSFALACRAENGLDGLRAPLLSRTFPSLFPTVAPFPMSFPFFLTFGEAVPDRRWSGYEFPRLFLFTRLRLTPPPLLTCPPYTLSGVNFEGSGVSFHR